jgi:hypothetical protein
MLPPLVLCSADWLPVSTLETYFTGSYTVKGPGGTSQRATVTVSFSSSLRIANTELSMPPSPPGKALRTAHAFPGIPFARPICFASVAGDDQRLFVCEQQGKIKVIPDVTAA